MGHPLPMANDDQPDPVVLDHCSPGDRDYLSERIYEFNVAATGIDDGRELVILSRDDDGVIVAGLYGWTWGGVCEIATLWVHESRRGRGVGTSLLRAAESEARARGVRSVELSTHSFQAPDFYARFGYTETGRRADYPAGHYQVLLSKSLDGAR